MRFSASNSHSLQWLVVLYIVVIVFHMQGRGLICFEEVHLPRGRQHCVVECVMVPKEVEMDAPIYFRKAMLEVFIRCMC